MIQLLGSQPLRLCLLALGVLLLAAGCVRELELPRSAEFDFDAYDPREFDGGLAYQADWSELIGQGDREALLRRVAAELKSGPLPQVREQTLIGVLQAIVFHGSHNGDLVPSTSETSAREAVRDVLGGTLSAYARTRLQETLLVLDELNRRTT